MTQFQKNQNLIKQLKKLLEKTTGVKDTKKALLNDIIELSIAKDEGAMFDCFNQIVKTAQKGARMCESIPLVSRKVEELKREQLQ